MQVLLEEGDVQVAELADMEVRGVKKKINNAQTIKGNRRAV